jgi:hypothetical protein
MTMHVENQAGKTGRRSRTAGFVRRLARPPIDFFRPNRCLKDDQLLVNGVPRHPGRFDEAHRNRHKPQVAAAQKTLETARAAQSKPYSLAGAVAHFAAEKIRSGFALAGWAALAAAGTGFGILAAVNLAKPDSELLQHATRSVRDMPPPTATDERGFFLGIAFVALCLLIAGLYGVVNWMRPPSATAE